MLNALLRETGRPVSQQEAEQIQRVHRESFAKQAFLAPRLARHA